jgi:hypothetical protein
MQFIVQRREPVFPAEPVLNIFVFIRPPRDPLIGSRGYVTDYGHVVHQMKGTDRAKSALLQAQLDVDLQKVTMCALF